MRIVIEDLTFISNVQGKLKILESLKHKNRFQIKLNKNKISFGSDQTLKSSLVLWISCEKG